MDTANLSLKRISFSIACALLIPAVAYAQPAFNVSPTSATLTGQSPTNVQVSSNSTNIGYAASINYPNAGDLNWLCVNPNGGPSTTPIAQNGTVAGLTTPDYLSLSVCGSPAINVTTHTATVTLNATDGSGAASVAIPVTYTLGAGGGGAVVATPSSITETISAGSSVGPIQLTLTTSSATPISFTVGGTPSWITWYQQSGNSGFVSAGQPAVLYISLSGAGLNQQTYNTSFTINAATGTLTVPITLNNGVAGSLAAPAVSSLSPNSVTAGSAGFTLQVNGSGFQSSSTVQWNGTALQTGFSSANQLLASITANLAASQGTASITVATPGAATSNAVTFTITAPAAQETETLVYSGTATGMIGGASFVNATFTVTDTVNVLGVTCGSRSTAGDCSVNGPPPAFTISGVGAGMFTDGISWESDQNFGGGAVGFGCGSVFGADIGSAALQTYSLQTSIGPLGPDNGSSVPGSALFSPTTCNASTSLGSLAVTSLLNRTFQATVTGGATVTSVTSSTANGTYTAGASISIQVNFSDVVAVTGFAPEEYNGPQLALNSGGTAVYSSQPGPTTLTFTYTVGANDSSPHLDYSSAGALTLFGATIPGAGSLALPVPGSPGSLGANTNMYIGATPPPVFNLSLSPTNMSFSATVRGGAPSAQSLTVSSTAGELGFTATASTGTTPTWLAVSSNTGITPATLAVSVNLAGLAAGTYSGSIVIASTAAGNNPQTVNVTLSVSPAPALTLGSAALNFAFQTGGVAPATQFVSVGSGGTALMFSAVATANNGGGWLSVTPASGTTPTNLSVSVNTAGLGTGTYTGKVTISSTGAANSPLSISVTLIVSAAPSLTASPSTLSFSYQAGGVAPATQFVAVGGSGAALTFSISATTTSGGNWLSVIQNSGTTPTSLIISVTPAGLGTGTYIGNITISATGAGNGPLSIPVTLILSAAASLTASPSTLSFSYQAGGVAPATQFVAVASSGAALTFSTSATTTSGGNWLSVIQNSGTTPTNLIISVNPAGLGTGTYIGSITIGSSGASNGPVSISITLTVSTAASLTASPPTLGFSYQTGGVAPATQSVTVGSSGTALPFAISATTTSGGNWLSVTQTSGTTPANLSVSVTPSGLGAGIYAGDITISSSGASNSPLSIPVTLTVSAAPLLTANPTTFTFSYQAGGAAPAIQSVTVGSSGTALTFSISATTTSGGNWLSVTQNSGTTPANLSLSVNTVGLGMGTYTASIAISSTGASNSPLSIPVTLTVSAAPVPLPTITAVVNAASFESGPISPGEIVTVGGTGMGPLAPAGLTLDQSGKVSTTASDVQVLFGGVPAPLTYVSSTQINVVVPYEIQGLLSPNAQVKY